MLFFKAKRQKSVVGSKDIDVPVAGKVVPIEQVPDDVFAKKMMGDGFAVIPQNGRIVSPVTGQITFVAETAHGIGITTDDGLELIIHLGIDTVTLKGAPFKILASEGQRVQQDEKLGDMDLEMIRKAELNPIVILAITNLTDKRKIQTRNYGELQTGSIALKMK